MKNLVLTQNIDQMCLNLLKKNNLLKMMNVTSKMIINTFKHNILNESSKNKN